MSCKRRKICKRMKRKNRFTGGVNRKTAVVVSENYVVEYLVTWCTVARSGSGATSGDGQESGTSWCWLVDGHVILLVAQLKSSLFSVVSQHPDVQYGCNNTQNNQLVHVDMSLVYPASFKRRFQKDLTYTKKCSNFTKFVLSFAYVKLSISHQTPAINCVYYDAFRKHRKTKTETQKQCDRASLHNSKLR